VGDSINLFQRLSSKHNYDTVMAVILIELVGLEILYGTLVNRSLSSVTVNAGPIFLYMLGNKQTKEVAGRRLV
jgi:hypothetical protein